MFWHLTIEAERNWEWVTSLWFQAPKVTSYHLSCHRNASRLRPVNSNKRYDSSLAERVTAKWARAERSVAR